MITEKFEQPDNKFSFDLKQVASDDHIGVCIYMGKGFFNTVVNRYSKYGQVLAKLFDDRIREKAEAALNGQE